MKRNTTINNGANKMITGPNGEKAKLKKNNKEYSLSYNGRVRFGNKKEIGQDISFFQTYGKLPERKVGWF